MNPPPVFVDFNEVFLGQVSSFAHNLEPGWELGDKVLLSDGEHTMKATISATHAHGRLIDFDVDWNTWA